MNQNELYHHGILGMKWGERRYQYEDGSLTPEGREHYGYGARIKGAIEKHKQNKIKKKRVESLKKAREAKKAKLEREQNKARVLKSGSASELLEYKGELTNQEMNDAINRINNERRIADLASSEKKSTVQKIDSVMGVVGKAADWADKGTRAYNAFAKINNAMSNDKNKMPLIGEKNDDNKQTIAMKKAETLLELYGDRELSAYDANQITEDVRKITQLSMLESYSTGKKR